MTQADFDALQAQADYYEEEAKRQTTNRSARRGRAEHDIEQLYGYKGEWLEKVVDHLGPAALTGEAIVYLAALQREFDARPR